MATNITDPIFHDEAKALAHIEASRWNSTPHCGHCGSLKVRRLAGKMVGYFQCNDCREKFTIRTGTIMERSHIPLHKWLLAMHLMAASKKGMSAKQMERMLGVTYKSAWFLCHRIREAMEGAAPQGPLGGPGEIVEADETYVGGKAKNRAFRAPAPKKPVVALVQHEGNVKSFHVANVTAKNVRPLLVAHVDRSSHLITDESPIYTRVGREFAAHSTVNHSAGQYVTHGGLKHTNTVEGFFSIFKRGVIGTYHHMSEAHLGRYCAEFDLRYNTRSMTDGERAAVILKGGEGRRLTYRRADKLAA
ncbi:IS1595 family transposase [Sphingomonas sp.]|uniref:IS1595 family transposase n=1 Tax=Sphingomonas sp. TaxID=28214 RepID=UPI003CC660B4